MQYTLNIDIGFFPLFSVLQTFIIFKGRSVHSVTAKDGDEGSPRPIKIINKGMYVNIDSLLSLTVIMTENQVEDTCL